MIAPASRRLRTIAITCAYKETQNLVKVLSKFSDRFVDEICIAIDCSKEQDLLRIRDTASTISIPVHVIANCEKKGVGYGLRQCIRYSMDRGYDIVIPFAGNNKDDPREIPRLLSPILNGGYDYIQGSRFLPGGRRIKNPVLRGIFSRIYPSAWTILTGVRCTDVTNGFRAYRVKILRDERVNIWQSWLNGYQMEYYIHYKALTLGYKTKEVPVSKVYPYRHKGGYSKINPFRDWWQIVGPLIYLKLGMRR